MSDASGAAKILGEAIAAERDAVARGGEADGEQLDLADLSHDEDRLGLPDAGDVLDIQQELGCDLGAAVIEFRRRAGKGGRKKGARNRRTDDFAAYLLQFGPHPGVGMMRVTARPVELLAAELGCSKLEAAAHQQRCREELLPYFEGKKPVSIDVSGRGGMALVLVDGGAIGGAIGGAGAGAAAAIDQGEAMPLLAFPENEENQAVISGAEGLSE